MTYCLAMRLDEGLVFLSDTRTNAGVDDVSTHRKLHVFCPGPDRVLVLQSAGNLATTQEVLDRLRRDLATPPPDRPTLATVEHLFEASLLVGGIAKEVGDAHADALGVGGSATFLVGGQIGDDEPDIHLVYPEGNYIRASEERPFLQIGETKYGKLFLELAVQAHVDLRQAAKIALSSMLSTADANLSVGPPYDLGIVQPGTYSLRHLRIEADSPFLDRLADTWRRHLLTAVDDLPEVSDEELAEMSPERR